MKYDLIIGIDPDSEKNGVAIVSPATRLLNCECLTFGATLAYLKRMHEATEEKGYIMEIVIEAGWLNHSNWHLPASCSPQRAAAIGRSVGMNHQTGILLAECCAALGYPYRLQKPLRKCWQGKDGKITHAELKAFTGIEGRTNQEERDAALLAWTAAGLPIRIQPKKK
jgi:hypothetical protein